MHDIPALTGGTIAFSSSHLIAFLRLPKVLPFSRAGSILKHVSVPSHGDFRSGDAGGEPGKTKVMKTVSRDRRNLSRHHLSFLFSVLLLETAK